MPNELDTGVFFTDPIPITAAGATDTAIVAGGTNARVRVVSVLIVAGATPPATVTLNSKGSGAGTAVSPAINIAATTNQLLGGTPYGLFQTKRGEALTFTNPAGTSAASMVIGYAFTY